MSFSQENYRERRTPHVLIWMGSFAPIGGIETFVADLGLELAQAGVPVELLAWDQRSKMLPGMRDAGVRVISSPWRWGCRWQLPDWVLFPLALWKIRQASVVVFAKTATHRMHRLFERFGRRKGGGQRFFYVTPYRPAELWSDDMTDAYRKEVTAMLQGFDVIVCQDEEFGRDLRALDYHGTLATLPYLPPAGADNPAPYPQGPLTLGFLGRLEYQKNLPELLKVFSLLKSEKSGSAAAARPLRLRVFGDGSLRTEMENRARELGIASSVEFHGAVPRERIHEAIQSCQLFCFTSHSEGQSLASLEILGEGRPIIATAVGALPNILTEPALGQVVPVGDTAAFLSAVKSMLARQEAGEVTPQQTVSAYRTQFNREQTVRRYIELLTAAPAGVEN